MKVYSRLNICKKKKKINYNFIQKCVFLIQDFGDGGAFPEIPMAQHPLNMGLEKKESSSNALAVQLDAQGKIKYDVLARQGHSKDKVTNIKCV